MKSTWLLLFFCLIIISAPLAAAREGRRDDRLLRLERLLLRVQQLPDRWEALPSPRVPKSGVDPLQVVNTASQAAIEAAHQRRILLSVELAIAAPGAVPQRLLRRLSHQQLTELDLWLPLVWARKNEISSVLLNDIEAWMVLAEAAGRPDVLFVAATAALRALRCSMPVDLVVPATVAWMDLPRDEIPDIGRGMLLVEEAEISQYDRKIEQALSQLHEARGLFEKIKDDLGLGDSWLGEGDLEYRRNHHDAARQVYEAALKHYGSSGSWYGMVRTANRSAQVAHAQAEQLVPFLESLKEINPDFETAKGPADLGYGVHLIKKKIESHASLCIVDGKFAQKIATKINDDLEEFRANLIMAMCHSLKKDDAEMVKAAYSAVDGLEKIRKGGTGEKDRMILANLALPYEMLIPYFAHKHGHEAEALHLAERAHTPVLLDLLFSDSIPALEKPNKRRRISSDKRAELIFKLAQIDRGLNTNPDKELTKFLGEFRREINYEIEQLDVQNRLYKPLFTGQSIKIEEIASFCNEVGPIILFYTTDRAVISFVMKPNKTQPIIQVNQIKIDELQKEIHQFRKYLANPLPYSEVNLVRSARLLWDRLMAPLAAHLAGHDRVIIIPHGPLHQLPFEALLDSNQKYLFERWHVSIAPSLSVLKAIRLRSLARPSTSSALFTLASGTGLQLPSQEATAVMGLFARERHVILPAGSSFESYAERAPRVRHLFIATHGNHIDNNQMETSLEIAPSRDHSSRFSAYEIATIPLQAELVTLAACDTSHGQAMLSDERLDLTRAFLVAGTSAVLATRWKVPDHPDTGVFLDAFYTALLRGGPSSGGLSKAEALTTARRLAQKRGIHAQIWAAWVLIGDGG